MSGVFPIQIPERLPVRLDVCPIVEAIFEARFVSPEAWATMPGLLFAQIRGKYPEQNQLPVARLPEEIRRQDPALHVLPMIQFVGDKFLIQLGPRVASLVAKPNAYPGWSVIASELQWFIECLKAAGFVGETERIGARYINFFDGDIFGALRLGVQINNQPLAGGHTDLTTVLRRGRLAIRLQVVNAAIVATKAGPKPGSVLDMEVWAGPPGVDIFGNGLDCFAEIHQTLKGIFFGLIKPDFLDKLKPTYA